MLTQNPRFMRGEKNDSNMKQSRLKGKQRRKQNIHIAHFQEDSKEGGGRLNRSTKNEAIVTRYVGNQKCSREVRVQCEGRKERKDGWKGHLQICKTCKKNNRRPLRDETYKSREGPWQISRHVLKTTARSCKSTEAPTKGVWKKYS